MKKPYSFRLPIELMEAAQKKAREEQRDLTNLIEYLVSQYLKKKKKPG